MERMVARQAEAWVVDLTPYTLACWYIFVVAMPLTHVLGLVAHAPRRAMARHVLLYPLLGGRTHSIFSILAWVRLACWSWRSLCRHHLALLSPPCILRWRSVTVFRVHFHRPCSLQDALWISYHSMGCMSKWT